MRSLRRCQSEGYQNRDSYLRAATHTHTHRPISLCINHCSQLRCIFRTFPIRLSQNNLVITSAAGSAYSKIKCTMKQIWIAIQPLTVLFSLSFALFLLSFSLSCTFYLVVCVRYFRNSSELISVLMTAGNICNEN